MDLVTLGVFLISFLVCLALVGFISLLGTKEQTYEDAVRMSREKMGAEVDKKAEKKKIKVNKKQVPSVDKAKDVAKTNIKANHEPLEVITTPTNKVINDVLRIIC